MRTSRPWLAAVAVVLALGQWPGAARAQQVSRPRSVLMLFSLRSTAPSVATSEVAFRRTLEASLGAPVDFHLEYLDLPDGTDVPYGERVRDLLAEKYTRDRFDLVVTQGAEALEFLLRYRSQLFPGVPIVFSNVSADRLTRLPVPKDATGSLLVLAGQRTGRVAATLLPDTRAVAIVSGSAPSDLRNAAVARSLVEQSRTPAPEVIWLVGLSLEEQLRRLATLPPASVVFFASYRADSTGRSMVAKEVLGSIVRAANAPTVAAVDTFLGDGIVGGDLIRYDVIAEQAASLAARILKGARADSLPPIAVSTARLTFDARELERWKIDESRLPEGSEVLFRPPTLWSQYKLQVLMASGLLLGQGLLIGALLLERRTRRHAQDGLAEAEHRYRTVADFTADWEYWVRSDGTFLYTSPSCAEVTGRSASDFAARPTLLAEIVVDDDRQLWDRHMREAASSESPTRVEFRIRTVAGETRWIDHVSTRVVGADGRDLGIRGSNRDITAKKRSEEDLRSALQEIRQLRDRLEVDNTYLREQLHPTPGVGGLVWSSDVMRYVLAKTQQVAPTSSTVLLLGETGVGKSLIAQVLHDLSPRRRRPLVTLNCAALPGTLIESELFGHEKGAFTGAHTQRRGRFEIADGSTLFLDEIGELPLDLQGKLLRAIQDGEFERVGGNVTLKTDVRLVAATNRQLDEEVRAGRFRQDLWYRLNVFPITVPPLRQRPEDIPLLVTSLLEKHCRKQGRPMLQVSRAVMKALQAREWPGNVRELENVVERAVISNQGSMFEIGEEAASPARAAASVRGGTDDRRTLAEAERDHMTATLERLAWRIEGDGGAADALGINASTLRSRMRKLGIQRPRPSTLN